MEEKIYDLLIKNGHVIDAANNIDEIMDVAVKDRKIAKVAKDIPESCAVQVADAKGCYVTPGIIDIHAHVFVYPQQNMSVYPDSHMLKDGLTTVVDAGTIGWEHFPFFREHIIKNSQMRVLAFLNIADKGMVDWNAEQNPATFHPGIAAEIAKEYSKEIVGIKAAHYWSGPTPYDKNHPAWASADSAVEAGELCNMPVMMDYQPNLPDSTYPDLILKHLRPGDIHTHVFAAHFPTVDKNGKVYDHMWKARERGVFFDVGHGSGSFYFRNAIYAYRDGFPPDTISTDLHTSSIKGAALSMLHLMGKYVNMGMPIAEVVKRSTYLPAKLINRPELGTLTVGYCADIAVIKEIPGDFDYIDVARAKLKGKSMLQCRLTVCQGDVTFDGFGMLSPLWEEAPEDYWKEPYLGDPDDDYLKLLNTTREEYMKGVRKR